MVAISAATRLAGVVGSPIGHSLSPVLFAGWIEAAGLDAVYLAFEPPRERFARFIDGLRGIVAGLNVTAPYKGEALAMADDASVRARRCGAANLLTFRPDGHIWGDNTDGEGLLAALRRSSARFDPAAGPAVVFGAGGAARGAAATLIDAGTPEIRIIARNGAAAAELADAVSGPVKVFAPTQAAVALADAKLIIQASPLGQGGGEGPALPTELAPKDALVLDMVYRPLETAFLRRARALGHPTVDGLWMLIGQAAPSFAAIFGRKPPDIDIRAKALIALGEAS